MARDVSTTAPLTAPALAPASARIPNLNKPVAPLANADPPAPKKTF